MTEEIPMNNTRFTEAQIMCVLQYNRARAIDWDQSDCGLSSGRAATVLQSRRRIHGRT